MYWLMQHEVINGKTYTRKLTSNKNDRPLITACKNKQGSYVIDQNHKPIAQNISRGVPMYVGL